ncbi:type III-A CRISPR-associated RAMP protein Csm3 [Thermaurantimonas aggregans]|uniref:CRISPR system Cms endoribonuclease Csm3 n=1 Tax=Thermaurantimonas aggregans TaxID=2173829 RepID=A0A401XLW2_9FLAO|nr:type III-A CRISPR-associated RAMP protein Csm3 [Thermaurantimonas aggregans]MCX8149528.1 type III-A CRISPR-associated RAMP protein Csm3 [Thermaurantimonas aggregans]GCD77996.1 type III-A CRISPR-associated RAMP protein Csm3 [Thermaurantimonas aggregans]
MLKLRSKIIITGKIKTLSGLTIGGTFSPLSIGAPDNIVIRNPISGKPYIPGSSLKGKIRSLIDVRDGSIVRADMNNVKWISSSDVNNISARLFGKAEANNPRPSRVIFRDAEILDDPEKFQNTDMPYTETKMEVVIDRITSAAMPRQIERVPAGAEFPLEIVINVFEGEANGVKDDEKEYVNTIFSGLMLLEDDYLGGKGSRGSGRVKITIDSIKERSAEYYKNPIKHLEKNFDIEIPESLRAQAVS